MGDRYLHHSLAVSTSLILLFSNSASSYDLWAFNVDNSPAPPPSKEPPFSAGANRNPADLKYEIIGIVGAYLASCLIIGILLLTVGRRLRRAAQRSHGTLSMELVKPNKIHADKSPSVKSNRWGGLASGRSSTKTSPEIKSQAKFDVKVLEQDRVKRDQEMERLYAAVLAAEGKPTGSVDERDIDARSSTLTASTQLHGHTRSLSSSSTSRSFSQRRPPQTQQRSNEQQAAPRPQPVGTIPALYPPYGPMPSDPAAATYTIHDTTHPYQLASSPPPPSGSGHSRQTSATSTIRSSNQHQHHHQQQAPSHTQSRERPRHTRTIKHMTISAPIPLPKHHSMTPSEEEAHQPLSPRYPPPPPASSSHTNPNAAASQQPTMPRPITPIDDQPFESDHEYSGTEEDDAEADYHAGQTPHYGYDEDDNYGYAGLSSRAPLPRENPQRLGSPPAVAIAPATNQRSPAHGRTPATNATGGVDRSLPLRSYSSTSAVPTIRSTTTSTTRGNAPSGLNQSQTQQQPHPQQQPQRAPGPSPTPTRTTFLSPRRDRFGVAQARARALASSGLAPYDRTLQSPGTAPLATPYSPYMPFSPVTPITPGLQSRDQRRRERREEGKRVQSEEADLVREEKDTWGDGW